MLASPEGRANIFVGLALLLAGAWGLRPALQGVHHIWSDKYGHFSHGYLVLAMALWLAWSSWREGPPVPTRPAWPVLSVLGVLVVAMGASHAMSINTITESLLPCVLLAAICSAYGWSVGRKYFWPVCFVYAALPVWWLINTPLQQLTAFVSNLLVHWTGVPAFVQGNSFHLPAGTVEIAAGCSGLAYLNAAFALALFQSLQYLRSWRYRLKLLAAAVLLALAFNWLRVYSLIVIAYATDMQHYLIRVDHLTYGWILFAFCIWPVFWYGVRLERRQEAAPEAASAAGIPAGGSSGTWQATVLAGAAVAALLLVPAMLQLALARGSARIPAAHQMEAGSRDNWLQVADALLAGAEETQLVATVAGQPVWVYRALDRSGAVSRDWPVTGRDLLGSQWQAGSGAPLAGQAAGVDYQQEQGSMRDTDMLLRSGLRVGGISVTGNLERKLALLKGIWRLRQDALLWMAITPCNPDCAAASARLDEWTVGSSNLFEATEAQAAK